MGKEIKAKGRAEQATIEAKIIRADGTVEELGVVSYWHRRWYKRLWWRLRHVRTDRGTA